MMDTIKNGALYIRVSTHEQEELSPDAQKRLLLDYARNNNIIVSNEHIYIDSGISGRKADKRPEFQRMIATAKSSTNAFDVILVWKYSRFARNQEESIVYKSLLKKKNVDVISISEPISDDVFGSLIERIIEWMDEYYSIRLSGEVFKGMSEKALRGGFQASPPLGYKILHKNETPVIVPEEAAIIKKIFSLYVESNYSIMEITRHLNSLCLKTRTGKPFEKRSVDYILQNPVYCGKLRWNRTENSTNRIKDSSEWIISQGNHEPIISEETYNKAMERYHSEYKKRNVKPNTCYKHWLSGIVKCSRCGRSLVSSTRKVAGRDLYYFQCYGYSKGKCTVSHSVSGLKLNKLIKDALIDIIEQPDNLNYEKILVKKESKDTNLLLEQLNKIDNKLARIKDAYINGIDSLEEYKNNKNVLQKEKNRIQSLIEKEQSLSFDKEDFMDQLENVYHALFEEDLDYMQKSSILQSICDKIVFDRLNESVDIYLYRKG